MQRRSSNTSAVFTLPDPGELNKRIHLRQRIDQAAADYGIEPVYQNEKDVWAKVRQVGATTYHESVQADETITHYMTIRYRRGITSDFEVVPAFTFSADRNSPIKRRSKRANISVRRFSGWSMTA